MSDPNVPRPHPQIDWRPDFGGKGTLFPLDADDIETPLTPPGDNYVPVSDSAQPGGYRFDSTASLGGGGSGSVDPAEIDALRALLMALAPLLSPNFLGTPTKSGVALATVNDVPDDLHIALIAQSFGG